MTSENISNIHIIGKGKLSIALEGRAIVTIDESGAPRIQMAKKVKTIVKINLLR